VPLAEPPVRERVAIRRRVDGRFPRVDVVGTASFGGGSACPERCPLWSEEDCCASRSGRRSPERARAPDELGGRLGRGGGGVECCPLRSRTARGRAIALRYEPVPATLDRRSRGASGTATVPPDDG